MASTNSRLASHRTSSISVVSVSKVQQTCDDFETSETSGRYRRCGGPPKVKPPAEKPPPPKPKEGDKPPEPVKQTQITIRPGVDF